MPIYLENGTPVNSPDVIGQVCLRHTELAELNRYPRSTRATMKAILNNRNALSELIGKNMKNPDQKLPVANLILRAVHVLGLSLGRRPDVKKDAPDINDSDRAKKKADKEARIIESLDQETKMHMLLPQVGRWVPGYGFGGAVLKQGTTANGGPFPEVRLFDPYQALPGQWGPGQHPEDLSIEWVMTRAALKRLYPHFEDRPYRQGSGGGVILSNPSWSNQNGGGINVIEYYNSEGCWWIAPESKTLLSYVPNLLAKPQFRLAKRFCFDELQGIGDGAVGVLANLVRLALLAVIAVEDSVMATELNVIGEMRGSSYGRGRDKINFFNPGTQLERNQQHMNFEGFQQADRFKDELRLALGHLKQSDGISPNSFVTGQGLQELGSTDTAELGEYFTVFGDWLQDLDSMRLEWLEKYYGDETLEMHGVRQGEPFAETYVPSKDIAGDYRTRRVYGAMAGFDQPNKIIAGSSLLHDRVIDTDTFREQIDGLENHAKIKERILAEDAEKAAMAALLTMAENGDPKAMQAAIGLLPAGKIKSVLDEVFAAPATQPAVPGAPAAPPPDLASVLGMLHQAQGPAAAGPVAA